MEGEEKIIIYVIRDLLSEHNVYVEDSIIRNI